MNTDIRVDVGFLDHWKTDTLMATLGAESVLALMRLWIFAAQNKPNGRLIGVQTNMIERIAKWRGGTGLLLQCLAETRLIEQDSEGVWLLHDWEKHQPHAERNALRAESPLPYDWNRRRYTVFIRDDFTCQYCGTPIEKPHCDHIIPRSRGGADTVDNLVTACPSCNLKKGDKTPEEWMQ